MYSSEEEEEEEEMSSEEEEGYTPQSEESPDSVDSGDYVRMGWADALAANESRIIIDSMQQEGGINPDANIQAAADNHDHQPPSSPDHDQQPPSSPDTQGPQQRRRLRTPQGNNIRAPQQGSESTGLESGFSNLGTGDGAGGIDGDDVASEGNNNDGVVVFGSGSDAIGGASPAGSAASYNFAYNSAGGSDEEGGEDEEEEEAVAPSPQAAALAAVQLPFLQAVQEEGGGGGNQAQPQQIVIADDGVTVAIHVFANYYGRPDRVLIASFGSYRSLCGSSSTTGIERPYTGHGRQQAVPTRDFPYTLTFTHLFDGERNQVASLTFERQDVGANGLGASAFRHDSLLPLSNRYHQNQGKIRTIGTFRETNRPDGTVKNELDRVIAVCATAQMIPIILKKRRTECVTRGDPNHLDDLPSRVVTVNTTTSEHDLIVVDHVPDHGPEGLVDDMALVNLLPRPNMWMPAVYYPQKFTRGGTIHDITIVRIRAARRLYVNGQVPNKKILA